MILPNHCDQNTSRGYAVLCGFVFVENFTAVWGNRGRGFCVHYAAKAVDNRGSLVLVNWPSLTNGTGHQASICKCLLVVCGVGQDPQFLPLPRLLWQGGHFGWSGHGG